jgi:hypothetical protein
MSTVFCVTQEGCHVLPLAVKGGTALVIAAGPAQVVSSARIRLAREISREKSRKAPEALSPDYGSGRAELLRFKHEICC